MNWRLAKAILILPGTALVYVPGFILWATRNGSWAASLTQNLFIWLIGGVAALVGFALMIKTVKLFVQEGGGGTLAPWDPIQKFIVVGPYRHCRNPMLSGVLFILLAASLLLTSWPLFAWFVFFFGLNTAYFKYVEEHELTKRYGAPYLHYKEHVNRWWPRVEPYAPEDLDAPRSN